MFFSASSAQKLTQQVTVRILNAKIKTSSEEATITTTISATTAAATAATTTVEKIIITATTSTIPSTTTTVNARKTPTTTLTTQTVLNNATTSHDDNVLETPNKSLGSELDIEQVDETSSLTSRMMVIDESNPIPPIHLTANSKLILGLYIQ